MGLGSAAIDDAARNVNATIETRALVTKRTPIVASLYDWKNNSSHASATLLRPHESGVRPTVRQLILVLPTRSLTDAARRGALRHLCNCERRALRPYHMESRA